GRDRDGEGANLRGIPEGASIHRSAFQNAVDHRGESRRKRAGTVRGDTTVRRAPLTDRSWVTANCAASTPFSQSTWTNLAAAVALWFVLLGHVMSASGQEPGLEPAIPVRLLDDAGAALTRLSERAGRRRSAIAEVRLQEGWQEPAGRHSCLRNGACD